MADIEELGDAYTCVYNDKTTAAFDVAAEFKDAMEKNWLAYLILIGTSCLSCLGGPLLCLRWITVTLNMIAGLGI